jgi:hypothetical protein
MGMVLSPILSPPGPPRPPSPVPGKSDFTGSAPSRYWPPPPGVVSSILHPGKVRGPASGEWVAIYAEGAEPPPGARKIRSRAASIETYRGAPLTIESGEQVP